MATAQLHSDLKSWTASSDKTPVAMENKRKYILPSTTDWTCTICERAINCAPVYQCTKGHLSCSLCHKNGKCCTSCPADAPSSIRNLVVETIIESMEMTCKFAPLGCKKTAKVKEESGTWEHEEYCSFKPMECPMPGCLQAGVEHVLPEHLLTKHNISMLVNFVDESYSPTGNPKYAGKFDLKPGTSVVMLRMPSRDDDADGWEHYLLHQDSTTWGETLRITALDDGFISLERFGKPTFKLEVCTSDKDGTYVYSLRSQSTSTKQQGGMLTIPKHPVGEAFNCTVTLLDVGGDDEEEDSEDDEDDPCRRRRK